MQGPELHTLLIRPLNATRIEYMVSGGVAAIIYGEPRLTNDIDIVADVRQEDAEALAHSFSGPEYYAPPVEVIRQEASRSTHGHFNILHINTALRADVYLAGNDPLSRWGLDRRRSVPLGEEAIWIAPIEYVILKKLEYHRDFGSERHLRDIANMVRLSGALIDEQAIESWVERLGLKTEWAARKTYKA